MSIKQTFFTICLILILMLSFGITGCEKVIVTDSGELTNWRFDYSDFTKLEIDHGFAIDIIYGETYSINVTIDRAVFEYLVVEQRGQNLHIGLEKGPDYLDTTQKAVVTMPQLQYLQLSDGCDGTLSGFDASASISFELTDNSSLDIPSYAADNVLFTLSDGCSVRGQMTMDHGEFKLSGVSRLDLEGSAADMILHGSGNSRFFMDDFPVDTADINLSSSNASVHVNTLLIFDLSDASHLDYQGNPSVRDIKVSGDSTVN